MSEIMRLLAEIVIMGRDNPPIPLSFGVLRQRRKTIE